ncbi:MAG: (2Fe-2S)-binding protein [Alphaproteobacteria bacterium]|nr:(2Fe-2S)-binding protein [Alphaproteobacteria bacterium]
MSLFRRLHEDGPGDAMTVTITVDGVALQARAGESVAAAVLASSDPTSRAAPVGGAPRAPYCMMGVCFDCLMEIDGETNRQSCMVIVREGMMVKRMARPKAVTP